MAAASGTPLNTFLQTVHLTGIRASARSSLLVVVAVEDALLPVRSTIIQLPMQILALIRASTSRGQKMPEAGATAEEPAPMMCSETVSLLRPVLRTEQPALTITPARMELRTRIPFVTTTDA